MAAGCLSGGAAAGQDEDVAKIEVRPARPADLEAVAGLRWRWVAERDGLPGTGRAEFVREFAAWALANAGSELDLVCLSGRGDKDLAEALARLDADVLPDRA